MSVLTTSVDAIDVKIIELLAVGRKTTEIAEELGFRTGKVHTRLEHLREHFDVHNAAHLVAEALRQGVIE